MRNWIIFAEVIEIELPPSLSQYPVDYPLETILSFIARPADTP
jgi:hypothetical protein